MKAIIARTRSGHVCMSGHSQAAYLLGALTAFFVFALAASLSSSVEGVVDEGGGSRLACFWAIASSILTEKTSMSTPRTQKAGLERCSMIYRSNPVC